MLIKQSISSSNPRKIVSVNAKSIKKGKKSTMNHNKSFRSLDARITRKSLRKFTVERVGKILDILPKFVKFYSKLTPNEIMAVKFYKGYGSYFQSALLADYIKEQNNKNKKSKKDSEKKQRELYFPFYLNQEIRLRQDIFQYGNNLIPFINSLDIKELKKYIETSYTARITLLNRLDKIYDKPDCPKMTGDEILFRGMRITKDIKKLKVGDTYLFKNFISTTIDRQVAEDFSSGECIFIFMDMKDIPFIYMPNSKIYSNSFSKFIMEQEPLMDLSEYTLPRNLEFKIKKIEFKPVNTWGIAKTESFVNLHRILKKQGYFNTNNTSSPLNTITDTTIDTTNTIPLVNKNNLIEKNIFPMAKFYYCTLHNWHPRTPISFEEISKNAKFILDQGALDSWSKELPKRV